jgi:flagellar motor switch protein FliM
MSETPNPFAGRVDDELVEQVAFLFRKIVPGLRRRLVNRVGTGVRVALADACSMTVGACLDAGRSAPTALCELTLAPGTRIPVLLDGSLLCRLLGLMLGEDPEKPVLTGRHLLTRVDLRIGTRVCEDLLETLSIQAGLEEAVSMSDVRPAPRTLPDLPRATRVLTASVEVGPEDAPFGAIRVLLPLNAAPVLFGTAPPLGVSGRRASVESILPVQVEVVAELARVTLPISALSALQVGGEIDLGRPADVVVSVNGKPALVAEAGESDGTRSVRVLGRSGAGANGPMAAALAASPA